MCVYACQRSCVSALLRVCVFSVSVVLRFFALRSFVLWVLASLRFCMPAFLLFRGPVFRFCSVGLRFCVSVSSRVAALLCFICVSAVFRLGFAFVSMLCCMTVFLRVCVFMCFCVSRCFSL